MLMMQEAVDVHCAKWMDAGPPSSKTKAELCPRFLNKSFVEICHLTWALNYKQNVGAKNIGEMYSKDPVLGNFALVSVG